MIAGGALLPVAVIENARSTRLTLRIVPGGQSLRLTVPPHVSETQIDDFLDRNRNWVSARIARLPAPLETENGALVPFLGIDHRIVHVNRLRGLVEPATENAMPVLRVPGAPEAKTRRLLGFFKQEARSRLDEAVACHASALGVRPKSIRIADTTSRWGSCSTTRTLSFSWRIVMAPAEVLDYLAAHEVAHLREMNHSPAFWDLVRELCPQMEAHKTWLRRNGNRLHAVKLA